MIISGIYKIINKVNGKYYVGSSNNICGNFKCRWRAHKRLLNKNKHYNKHLQRAWNKYGQKNFDFVIVEENISKNKLLLTEQKYLDICKKNPKESYNENYVAEGGMKTQEQIDKIKKFWTPSKRKQRSKKMLGNKNPFYKKHHSNESKEIMRKLKINKPLSDEHRKNIGKANIGKKNGFWGKHHSEATKEVWRKLRKGDWAGIANPKYDPTVYNFINRKTKETFKGTKLEFKKKYNKRFFNGYWKINPF